mgnify:CR=1 FL=1
MANVYLDIETLPGSEYPSLDEIQTPSNYKDEAKIQAYKEAKLDEVYRQQALDSMQGRILCIGVAVEDEEPHTFYTYGENEWDALLELKRVIDFLKSSPTFIGHNVKNFDLQWIWRHAARLGLKHLCNRIPRHKFSDRVQDTAEIWAGPDFKAVCSLDRIAAFLGIDGKGEMDGSMVYDAFMAGEHEKIRSYCADDVRLTRSVYKALPDGK